MGDIKYLFLVFTAVTVITKGNSSDIFMGIAKFRHNLKCLCSSGYCEYFLYKCFNVDEAKIDNLMYFISVILLCCTTTTT